LVALDKERAMRDRRKATSVDPLKLGDRVKIKGREDILGRIIEFRGALGPGGASVYGVQIQNKPAVSYIELREDQIELAPIPARVRRIKSPKISARVPKASKRVRPR
jgi:hypothetical protein